MKKWLKRIVLIVLLLIVAVPAYFLIIGRDAFFPADVVTNDRLAALPTQGRVARKVTIHWNEYQVPFLEAETDADLAYGMGIVHGHLRMSQIMLMRYAAEGRIGQVGGPFTDSLDHLLALIDFDHAVPEIEKNLPEETRAWLQAYANGLNDMQDHMQAQGIEPPFYGLANIEPEPFTVTTLLRMGRLTGIDVNWLAYLGILGARKDDNWAEVWQRVLEHNGKAGLPVPSKTEGLSGSAMDLVTGFTHSGSNSIAISPKLSASGNAILANDPHLGLGQPNFWLLVGIKSPSYHAVGFTIPGMPVLGLARTPDFAWGGTNARMSVSDLYTLREDQKISQSENAVPARFWNDSKVTTEWADGIGPLMTSHPRFTGREGERIAMRWVGHEPSDEITAFLTALKAKTPQQFRASFKDYAVGAYNLVFADTKGNIGMVRAVRLPKRNWVYNDDIVLDAGEPSHQWQGFDNATTLPMQLNPASGFVADANNKPKDFDKHAGLFFTPDVRVRRMAQMVEELKPIDRDDIKRMHQDVYFAPAVKLRDEFIALYQQNQVTHPVLEALAQWDGHYKAESAGALKFELLLYYLAHSQYADAEGKLSRRVSHWPFLFTNIVADVNKLPSDERKAVMREAIASMAERSDEIGVWGNMLREKVGSYVARAPVVGGLLELDDAPAGGSRDTLMKRNHKLTDQPHTSDYGAQSRHYSDMGDPDANWFVLYGGQDGWMGSENFADQIELWRKGEYIQMPLTMTKVRAQFKTKTVIQPKQ